MKFEMSSDMGHIKLRYEYEQSQRKYCALSWNSAKDGFPTLSARDAYQRAESFKQHLLKMLEPLRCRVSLGEISLMFLGDQHWVWVTTYRLDSVDSVPLQGQPILLEIPVLMTGEIPVIEVAFLRSGGPEDVAFTQEKKQEKENTAKRCLPLQPKNKAPDREPRTSRKNSIFSNPANRQQLSNYLLEEPAFVGEDEHRAFGTGEYINDIDVSSTVQFQQLAAGPQWIEGKENPPLSPKAVLSVADKKLKEIMKNCEAEDKKMYLTEIGLVSFDYGQWLWVVRYHEDYSVATDLYDPILIDIPVLMSGELPEFQYSDESADGVFIK